MDLEMPDCWPSQKSAPAAAAAGVKKPHHWRSTLYIYFLSFLEAKYCIARILNCSKPMSKSDAHNEFPSVSFM
jgi:hypothetical protein